MPWIFVLPPDPQQFHGRFSKPPVRRITSKMNRIALDLVSKPPVRRITTSRSSSTFSVISKPPVQRITVLWTESLPLRISKPPVQRITGNRNDKTLQNQNHISNSPKKPWYKSRLYNALNFKGFETYHKKKGFLKFKNRTYFMVHSIPQSIPAEFFDFFLFKFIRFFPPDIDRKFRIPSFHEQKRISSNTVSFH